ncbi:SCO1/SenC family protein (plasmid) [Ruegeria pomeroyi DSS-3]|uniref:SCO1/SenC family protein n=2 Tax=Ruegeria pomeroyi TaxID=89184 RepID=Q5LL46_RUEPO|nr:SCO family protein [Ruegeria pomeroyi]AAV97317.1 SCO1/SenC family protein [Ruegeria pomeroyi DSS-3]NVK96788.1 SCO family protein [Ruegeria pomeroyi]NVL00006.1 SCO family protein [Ruegeria pomeroyi]HCE71362.1 SCO family protein [Ruegeria sp.]
MLRPALASVLAAVIGGGFLWYATDGAQAFTSEAARRLDVARSPRPVPAVRLEDMNDRTIALTPQNGEVVLVEFIYTVCGDICQIAAGDFAAIRDKLRAQGADVRLISVSFDPLRDTPEQMRIYGENHDADGNIWTVARPALDDLEALLTLFGVTVIPDEWGGFQHNAAIHVIDGEGRFSAVFDTDAVAAVVDRVAGEPS